MCREEVNINLDTINTSKVKVKEHPKTYVGNSLLTNRLGLGHGSKHFRGAVKTKEDEDIV